MFKSLIFILITFSFVQAYQICSENGAYYYYCSDGYGCCSDTTCGRYCSGGGSGGSDDVFPWWAYILLGLGLVCSVASIKVCCRKHKQRRNQRHQQLLQV